MNTIRYGLNVPQERCTNIKNKKSWVKPDIEIISKDVIHGGSLAGLLEGQTSYGYSGAS